MMTFLFKNKRKDYVQLKYIAKLILFNIYTDNLGIVRIFRKSYFKSCSLILEYLIDFELC